MSASTKIKPCIIASSTNELVVSKLINGAYTALQEIGVFLKKEDVFRVPGALEIPLMLKQAVFSGLYDIYIVLGVVVKGQTDHYKYVSRMSHHGVMHVALENSLALANGILTVDEIEQALERAGGTKGNMGYDATIAAIKLKNLFNQLIHRSESL